MIRIEIVCFYISVKFCEGIFKGFLKIISYMCLFGKILSIDLNKVLNEINSFAAIAENSLDFLV